MLGDGEPRKPTLPHGPLKIRSRMVTYVDCELLKLCIRLSKRSIQKILRPLRRHPLPGKQSWKTFLVSHAGRTWTADFLTATTLGFHQPYPVVNKFSIQVAIPGCNEGVPECGSKEMLIWVIRSGFGSAMFSEDRRRARAFRESCAQERSGG